MLFNCNHPHQFLIQIDSTDSRIFKIGESASWGYNRFVERWRVDGFPLLLFDSYLKPNRALEIFCQIEVLNLGDNVRIHLLEK